MTATPGPTRLPDEDALLVALVLAPATYSRNRFFDLYRDEARRRVHRRALTLRSIVRHLGDRSPARRAHVVALEGRSDGEVMLRYEIESLGLRRAALLTELELTIVRHALRHAGRPVTALGGRGNAGDRHRLDAALAPLAPLAPLPGGAEHASS
jgi:hypothetical protein